MRRWIIWTVLIGGSVALIPPVLIARMRTAFSTETRIHIIPDMDSQPKYKPQQTSELFADHRAQRRPVPGTVAVGELHLDDHLYRGKVGNEFATAFPMVLDESLLRRGQERFNIFCATCHGLGGYGDGMVAKRAEELQEGTWVPPLSFHTDEVRNRPPGYMFDVITNGIRTMPAYGPQIPVEDRWAITAYVRALQRSQHGRIEDLPVAFQERMRE